MKIEQNISLKPYNTFGIDVNAKSYCNISSIDELTQCLEKYKEEKLFILGGGSNMLLTKDIEALWVARAVWGDAFKTQLASFLQIRRREQ